MISSFNFPNILEVEIIIPILEVRELRLRVTQEDTCAGTDQVYAILGLGS